VLMDHGYTVDIFHRGKPGIEAIRCQSYDLVLLDLKLPDMDGMEALKEIHRDRPGLNVIIMTGYASVQNAIDSFL